MLNKHNTKAHVMHDEDDLHLRKSVFSRLNEREFS